MFNKPTSVDGESRTCLLRNRKCKYHVQGGQRYWAFPFNKASLY